MQKQNGCCQIKWWTSLLAVDLKILSFNPILIILSSLVFRAELFQMQIRHFYCSAQYHFLCDEFCHISTFNVKSRHKGRKRKTQNLCQPMINGPSAIEIYLFCFSLHRVYMREKFLSDLRSTRDTLTGKRLKEELDNLCRRLDDPNIISAEIVRDIMYAYRDIQVTTNKSCIACNLWSFVQIRHHMTS